MRIVTAYTMLHASMQACTEAKWKKLWTLILNFKNRTLVKGASSYTKRRPDRDKIDRKHIPCRHLDNRFYKLGCALGQLKINYRITDLIQLKKVCTSGSRYNDTLGSNPNGRYIKNVLISRI